VPPPLKFFMPFSAAAPQRSRQRKTFLLIDILLMLK